MPPSRFVVWLNHAEAHVLQVHEQASSKTVIAQPEHPRLHRREGSVTGARAPEDREFLGAVTRALEGADALVLSGPGLAKQELLKHLQRHAPVLAQRVVAVQTSQRVPDETLVRDARECFRTHEGRARLGL